MADPIVRYGHYVNAISERIDILYNNVPYKWVHTQSEEVMLARRNHCDKIMDVMYDIDNLHQCGIFSEKTARRFLVSLVNSVTGYRIWLRYDTILNTCALSTVKAFIRCLLPDTTMLYENLVELLVDLSPSNQYDMANAVIKYNARILDVNFDCAKLCQRLLKNDISILEFAHGVYKNVK